MESNDTNTASRWLAVLVLLHLAVTAVHGTAHAEAPVLVGPLAGFFVFAVIIAGPLVGLGLTRWSRQAGAWVVALTLAGACVFGVLNHFVVSGTDHVSHVGGPWHRVFALTAVVLAVTELAGAGLAVAIARKAGHR